MTEREAELTVTIEKLIWGMHLWGRDEDNSIHPDAYGAFCEALTVARIPVTITRDSEDHETRYRFDHDWARRMRETAKVG
jgi:hypothetical protein